MALWYTLTQLKSLMVAIMEQSDEAVSWGKIKGSAKPICIESWDVFSILLMEAKVLI
jgi:hypothetical protein